MKKIYQRKLALMLVLGIIFLPTATLAESLENFEDFNNVESLSLNNLINNNYQEIFNERYEERKLTKEEAEKLGYSYKENNNEIKITAYTGDEDNIIIPSEIDGISVVEIEKKVFENKEVKGDVIIPRSIKKIRRSFF